MKRTVWTPVLVTIALLCLGGLWQTRPVRTPAPVEPAARAAARPEAVRRPAVPAAALPAGARPAPAGAVAAPAPAPGGITAGLWLASLNARAAFAGAGPVSRLELLAWAAVLLGAAAFVRAFTLALPMRRPPSRVLEMAHHGWSHARIARRTGLAQDAVRGLLRPGSFEALSDRRKRQHLPIGRTLRSRGTSRIGGFWGLNLLG